MTWGKRKSKITPICFIMKTPVFDVIQIYWCGTEDDIRENLSNSLYFLKRISESLKQDFSTLFSDHERQYFGKLKNPGFLSYSKILYWNDEPS